MTDLTFQLGKWDERFLRLSEHISTWSRDPSTRVGAVIVDSDRRVVSVGFNGLPMGVTDSEERLNDRDLKYKIIVHGERNAMLFAHRSLAGCTLYTWPFQPCATCSSMVIQAGITRVVSLTCDNDRWKADMALGTEIFQEAGVRLQLYPGRLFGYAPMTVPQQIKKRWWRRLF